jgi:broad specificity phosphatase PhoE
VNCPELLVLARHGESEGNLLTSEERARFEVPTHKYVLTPRGRAQAEITGQYLRERFGDFDFYYVSYYARSRETMEIMYPGVKLCEDPRLAEAQRGIYHTMTKEEIMRYFPKELERKEREGWYHHRPLGGENWPDIELRIYSFKNDALFRRCRGKKVIIVGHGNWLVLFQRTELHLSIDETLGQYKAGRLENTSVTVYEGVEKDGESRLVLREENIVPWRGKI